MSESELSNSKSSDKSCDNTAFGLMDAFEPLTRADTRELLHEEVVKCFLCIWSYACMACEKMSGCSDKPNYKYI